MERGTNHNTSTHRAVSIWQAVHTVESSDQGSFRFLGNTSGANTTPVQSSVVCDSPPRHQKVSCIHLLLLLLLLHANSHLSILHLTTYFSLSL